MPIASTVLIREILPLGKYKRNLKLCRKQVKWYLSISEYIDIFFILKRMLILVRSYNFYDSIALLFHGRRGNFNVSLRRTFNILRKALLWNWSEKLRSRVKNDCVSLHHRISLIKMFLSNLTRIQRFVLVSYVQTAIHLYEECDLISSCLGLF